MSKIQKFSPGGSIFLWNFAQVIGKVSLHDFLPLSAALRPKIPIRYLQPGCNQLVLLIIMRPKAVFGTFDCGASISLPRKFDKWCDQWRVKALVLLIPS